MVRVREDYLPHGNLRKQYRNLNSVKWNLQNISRKIYLSNLSHHCKLLVYSAVLPSPKRNI